MNTLSRLLLITALAPVGWAADGYLIGIFGQKDLNSDWGELDTHTALGLGFGITFGDSPFAVMASFTMSEDDTEIDDFKFRAETTEFMVGVGLYGKHRMVAGYVGVGPTFASGSLKISDQLFPYDSATFKDSAVGFAFWGGFSFVAMEHLGLGVHFSYSSADIAPETNGVKLEADAGGMLLAFSAGFHF